MNRVLKAGMMLGITTLVGCSTITFEDISQKNPEIYYVKKTPEETRVCLLQSAASQGGGAVKIKDSLNRSDVYLEAPGFSHDIFYILTVEPHDTGSKIEVRYDDYSFLKIWSTNAVAPCLDSNFTHL